MARWTKDHDMGACPHCGAKTEILIKDDETCAERCTRGGDPTCGMKDDPAKCNGAAPCFYCCCGCEGGCGTGHETRELVTDPMHDKHYK